MVDDTPWMETTKDKYRKAILQMNNHQTTYDIDAYDSTYDMINNLDEILILHNLTVCGSSNHTRK